MRTYNFTSSFLAILSLGIASIIFLISSPVSDAQSVNPLSLKASVLCTSGVPKVSLSWVNFNNSTHFDVYRNPSLKGTPVWVDYADSVSPSYTDVSVSVGKSYSYQVRSLTSSGVEKYSDIVSLTTITCPAEAPKISFNPALSTSCTGVTPTVNLSWTNPNGAKSFTIWRNPTATGGYVWGSHGTSAVTAYSDSSVKLGSVYQYQISGVGADGSTRYSDIISSGAITCPSVDTGSTPPPVVVPPAPVPQKELVWGVYAGWKTSDVADFVATTGENPDMVSVFIHWGNGNAFPSYMAPEAKDKNRTLIVFWEASNYLVTSNTQPAFSYDAITRGDWDAYIKGFAAAAKEYGGPVILIPFSEMNGNWSPWSGVLNGNTPAKAVAGYRHVHTVFGDVPNVKFGWAVNSNSVPDTSANAIGLYYPGDQYVDYVGVDGFNFNNPWVSFNDIFSKPLTLLSAYNKPIYIFSFASAEGTQKAEWIRKALTEEVYKYPLIEGWNWFNQNKEHNWLIWSDSASLTAFKNAVN